VTFSSDLVFDGAKRAPYVESDGVRPLCEYGSSKAAAEVMVLELDPCALVVRTAAFFGEHDDYNFVTRAVRALVDCQPVTAPNDVVVSPTYVPDLVDTVLDLAIDGENGVWHLANAGAITWEALAREAAALGGVSAAMLTGVPVETLRLPARRPVYSALTSERAAIMPSLDDALARYARARPWERHGG
jgi:dTDP-4-dehydrorhamnose reductase